VTSTETADQSASAPRDAYTPRPTVGETRIPPAGQYGHGVWACLRRQPIKMVRGRAEGGYTNRFELICPDCGDHPAWNTPRSDPGCSASADRTR